MFPIINLHQLPTLGIPCYIWILSQAKKGNAATQACNLVRGHLQVSAWRFFRFTRPKWTVSINTVTEDCPGYLPLYLLTKFSSQDTFYFLFGLSKKWNCSELRRLKSQLGIPNPDQKPYYVELLSCYLTI